MGKIAWQILGVGGTALAAVAARKAIAIVWEKSTKRPVPINPQQPGIGMSEAVAWTIVSGVGIAIAQLVVQRAAADTVRRAFGETSLPKKFRAPAELPSQKRG